jgi:hypothetical protein
VDSQSDQNGVGETTVVISNDISMDPNTTTEALINDYQMMTTAPVNNDYQVITTTINIIPTPEITTTIQIITSQIITSTIIPKEIAITTTPSITTNIKSTSISSSTTSTSTASTTSTSTMSTSTTSDSTTSDSTTSDSTTSDSTTNDSITSDSTFKSITSSVSIINTTIESEKTTNQKKIEISENYLELTTNIETVTTKNNKHSLNNKTIQCYSCNQYLLMSNLTFTSNFKLFNNTCSHDKHYETCKQGYDHCYTVRLGLFNIRGCIPKITCETIIKNNSLFFKSNTKRSIKPDNFQCCSGSFCNYLRKKHHKNKQFKNLHSKLTITVCFLIILIIQINLLK